MLPGKWQDLLVSGEGPYASRSQAAMALAVAMANRGWSWQDFHAALTDPMNEMGSYYTHRKNGAPRTSHDRMARLQRDWAKAREIVTESPAVSDRTEMSHELSLDLAVLNDEVWTGRTAVVDKLILTACYTLGIEKGRRSTQFASRTLAEMTGVSQSTAARALGRLWKAGELRLQSLGQGENATVYSLVKRQCASDSGTSRGWPPPGGESSAHTILELVSSNAFRWLGRYAAVIHRSIDRGARTIAEIMESSGISRRTVHKYLGLLRKVGLVSQDCGEYTARDVEDLDELAQEIGVTRDYAGEQCALHRHQRTGWRLMAARVVRARKWAKINRRA